MLFKAAVVAAAALSMSGCLVTSLEPLYSDKEIVTDPGLAGYWDSTNDADSMVVLQQDQKRYRLIFMDEGKAPGAFDLRIVQLGKVRFFDLFPAGPAGGSDTMQGHHFPVHSFGRLERNGDSLRFKIFNKDWLNQQFQANPNLLPHRTSGEALLLTASTPELQKFLLARAEEPGVFGEWATYQRHR